VSKDPRSDFEFLFCQSGLKGIYNVSKCPSWYTVLSYAKKILKLTIQNEPKAFVCLAVLHLCMGLFNIVLAIQQENYGRH